MRKALYVTIALLALGALLCAPLSAHAKRKAAKDDAVDPKAAAVFSGACAYLASLKGYSFKAETLLDLVYPNGAKIQVARNMDVTVQRPNAFKIVTKGDDTQSVSVFDGKTFTLALPDKKIFGQLPAVMDIDGLEGLLSEKYDLESPLGDLLLNDPCGQMTATSGKYLGLGLVGEIKCHHLFFEGQDIDWQIWIEDGPKPLARKLVITEKRLAKAPQFTAFLNHWQLGDNPPAVFMFTPPQDLTRDGNFFARRAWKQ